MTHLGFDLIGILREKYQTGGTTQKKISIVRHSHFKYCKTNWQIPGDGYLQKKKQKERWLVIQKVCLVRHEFLEILRYKKNYNRTTWAGHSECVIDSDRERNSFKIDKTLQ